MATKIRYELKPGPATREAFGRTLAELGRENRNVVVCDADLSKSTYTHLFAKEFPERFFECGIAEANMVALGAGLASSGKIAFVSSFSAFVLNKGYEQLRVTAAYPNVNLKVVGTHSGISIGEDGPSQMSVEDLALACSLAGFSVLSPCDDPSMSALIREAAAHVGPVFVRAGRAKVPVVYANGGVQFKIGGSQELVEGSGVTLMAHGLMVAESIKAAEALEAEGISARVIDMYSIKPLDKAAVAKAAKETGAIVVSEEHMTSCGLGSHVAQAVAVTAPCPMEFVGIGDTYAESGTPEGLLEKYGLTAAKVAEAARRVVKRKR
jgi:transketolase